MSSTITALTSGGGLAMAGDTSGQLQLLTNNGTAAVTVDTSQNVGIGTSSPASKLDVKAGSGSVISRSTSGVNFKAFYDDGRTTYASVNYDGLSTSGAQDLIIAAGAGASQVMQFRTADTERMRIDGATGNVLINQTSSTGYKLAVVAVAGGGAVDMYNGSTNGYYAMAIRNPSTNHYAALFTDSGNNVGTIITTSSSTAYNTSSDYRLKENVQLMTGALNKVAQLKPCTYKWKFDGSDGQGFIAHELAEVVPDAVSGEKDELDNEGNPRYQGVDASFLVATLTAAIQELNAKVEAQAATITELQAKIG